MLIHTPKTKHNAGGVYGATPMRLHWSGAVIAEKQFPKEVFPLNYEEGGWGTGRARNTKRPHFSLLSHLR